jgi:hypothetical protein
MAVKAMRKLGVLRQRASAIKKGTEGMESPGLDHSRAHDADVLSTWNEGHGSTMGLLVPFEDHRIRIGHAACSVLPELSPVLRRQHPVGHVLTEKDVWNQFCDDSTVVIGPGPSNGPYVGRLACFDANNASVKRLRGRHEVSLTVGKGVTGPIVDKNRVTVNVEVHRSPLFLISRGTEGSWCLGLAVEGPIEVRWQARPCARIPERHKQNDGQYEQGVS